MDPVLYKEDMDFSMYLRRDNIWIMDLSRQKFPNIGKL